MTSSFSEARKRRIARLDGARPSSAHAAWALAKSTYCLAANSSDR